MKQDQFLVAQAEMKAGARIHSVKNLLQYYVSYASLSETTKGKDKKRYEQMTGAAERVLRKFVKSGQLGHDLTLEITYELSSEAVIC